MMIWPGGIAIITRRALLVLGMHRSGTSALAGLLAQLGAHAPKTLMGGDANNPQGYWESRAFHDFHEDLLRSAANRWDSWTELSTEWLQSAAASETGAVCRELVRGEFGDAPLFVLKDPRMCRLLPFWLPVMESARIKPSAILVLRNPYDVARSLERRNGLPIVTSLLIWLRHVLDAEHHTRTIGRSIVRCDDLRERWSLVVEQIGRDLDLCWPVRTADARGSIGQLLASGVNQSYSNVAVHDAPEPLQRMLERTEAVLASLADQTQPPASAMAELDAIRIEFGGLARVVDGVAAGLDARTRTEVTSLERQLMEARAELTSLQATILELRRQLSDANALLGQAVTDRAASEQDRERLRTRLGDSDRQMFALEAERGRLTRQIEEIYTSKSWRVTAPLRALWGAILPRRP